MCDDVDYVEMRNDPPHLTIDFGGESFQDLTRAASWPKLCNTICSVIQERSTLCASNCISNLYFASKGKRFSETILLFDEADIAPIQRWVDKVFCLPSSWKQDRQRNFEMIMYKIDTRLRMFAADL